MFGAFIFSSLSPSRVKKEEQREDCDENIFEEENKKKKVRDWLLVHARVRVKRVEIRWLKEKVDQ